MATSLAEQLKRLSVPQAANLVTDRRRTPSILFESKEAAEKDRNTIYELGLSGLHELTILDGSFGQFRNTMLFDEFSKEVERSVENIDKNVELDNLIRQFLYHISPYFLLQPAHKCIEWLIRRFRIQDFNTDDFVCLLLIYHESKVAARCIQILNLKNSWNNRWSWLMVVKKSGSPISKQTLINHSVGQPYLLELMGNFTYGAVKVLDKKAASLQVVINFYCQLAVATMNVKLTDNMLKSILHLIKSGFQSSVADFKAMAYIMACTVITKRQISQRLSEDLVIKAMNANIKNNFDQEVANLLLLIYQYQENFVMTAPMLDYIFKKDNFFSSLNVLYCNGYDILCILRPLLQLMFTDIQIEKYSLAIYQQVTENFTQFLQLNNREAKEIIAFIFEHFTLNWPKIEEKTLECINDERIKDINQPIMLWQIELLRVLEKRHPEEFDQVIEDSISDERSNSSKSFKNSLGYFFKSSSSQRNIGLFVQLFHANLHNRHEDIEHLLQRFDKLTEDEEGKLLLRPLISARLEDDDPVIIENTLEMGGQSLSSLLTVDVLVEKLSKILARGLGARENMRICVSKAIEILIVDGVLEGRKLHIAMLLYPYVGKLSNPKLERKVSKIIRSLSPKVTDFQNILEIFENCEAYAESNVNYLVNYFQNNLSSIDALNIFNTIKRFINLNVKTKRADILMKVVHSFISSTCMKTSEVKIRIYYEIIENLTNTKDRTLVCNTLNLFLNELSKCKEDEIEFLSQFCIINNHSPTVILTTLKTIASINKKKGTTISDISFIRILYALIAPEYVIRKAAFDVIESLPKTITFDPLIQNLIRTKEELLLDHHQLPLAIYTSFTIDSGKIALRKDIQTILSIVINYAKAPSTSSAEKALIMHLLMHINSVDLFERLLSIGMEVLKNGGENEYFFTPEESVVLKYFLNFIGKEFAVAANKNETVQNFLLILLKTVKMIKPPLKEKPTPLAAATIMLITPEIYRVFTDELKTKIIETILQTATVSDNVELYSALHHMFKSTTVSYKIVQLILERMKNSQGDTKIQVKARHRSKSTISPEITQVINSINWRMGVTTLELYQSKLHIDKSYEIIPTLFEILQILNDLDEHPAVEYTKQLVLSSVLLGCQKQVQKTTLNTILKVDLVMQCIRGTQNSQTHHHALLLLAHIAAINPDQVLHEVVSIFTFMGSSVARYDDDYSFQIMSQIIQNILPTIVQNKQENEKQVVAVLRVFADIVLDVPTHRQLTVYKKLVETLGTAETLWVFLSLLLQTHVANLSKEKSSKTKKRKNEYEHEELSPRVEIALLIAREFSTEAMLETCTKLIHHISNLPHNDEKFEATHVFDVKAHSGKKLRIYRYIAIQFVKCLLSSSIKRDKSEALQPFCSNLIADTLRAIPGLVKASSGENHLTYWRVILSHYYDILECAIGLLNPDLFLKTVHELILNHKINVVRIKVMEMLNDKLLHHEDYFEGCNERNIIVLLGPLKDIIDTIGNETLAVKGYTHIECWTMQQLTLTCIKLLSRIYANKFKDEFIRFLDFLVSKTHYTNKMPDNLMGGYILCLSEICACLKAHSITSLHAIIPCILEVLQTKSATHSSLLLISAVTAIQTICEALPNFLSPYLVSILVTLSNLFTEAMEARQSDESATLLTKLQSLWHVVALSIPARVIIPAINNSYVDIVNNQRLNAVGPIMELSTECFNCKMTQDLQNLQPIISELILRALKFRSDHLIKHPQDSLNKIEECIIKAINSLVLKLSESAFRPLFFKIHEWAFDETTSESKHKLITYFKLSNSLIETIKSLFLLFADDLVKPAAILLVAVNDSKATQLCFNSTEDNSLLLKYILKTLYNIATCDNEKFMNEDRFSLLMDPVIDQLDNSLIKGNEDMKNILKNTITAIGVAVADVILWKQLNLQLLAKTRLDDPEIKILALQTSVALAQKLGQDYIQLLPETIPFIAELMESGIYEVEQVVQSSLQELEVAIGENLQKYF